MQTKPEIEKAITNIIVEQLGVDPKNIKPESEFIKDLGADSLDLVELVMAVESEYDPLEIPDEDAEKLTTVQALIDYVDRKLNQEGPQQ